MTPDEPTAKIRPHPCAFISGTITAESSMTRTNIISSCFESEFMSTAEIFPGGGPPVFATKISACPICSFTANSIIFTALGVSRSAITESAFPPRFLISCTILFN